MIGIAPVGLPRGHHAAGRDESRELVDVAVGVVAGEFAADPEHAVDAQAFAEHLLEPRPCHARVAGGILDAAMVDQQRAFAVGLDRAPFEHEPALEDPQAQPPADRSCQPRVVVPRRILAAPGVPLPADGGRPGRLADPLSGFRHEKHRPRVAQPGVVGGEVDEFHIADAAEPPAGQVEHRAGGHHLHRFVAGEQPRDLLEHRRDLGEVAEPGRLAMRPGKPGGRMRLPFGREPVAKRGGTVGSGHALPQRFSRAP